QAVDQQTNFLILFDENASEDLRQVALIQHFTDPKSSFKLQMGDCLTIDQVDYPITYVGRLVNQQLSAIGHVVLNFAPVDAQPMQNSIYLKCTLPIIQVGSRLIYKMGE
ncbi:hypothetical protein EQ500_15950, partial [Lactobacillus sp. XV13L]|nr:hypothetical protein [Lactobacillus sp. XV13L]